MEVPRPQFALAWFHAVLQERRTYIPQGWVKLYEFNDTDLNAALHILKQRLKKGTYINLTCFSVSACVEFFSKKEQFRVVYIFVVDEV